MMQLSYRPNCLDFEHNTRGCAAYVATTLSKPLEIGKNYELSFWINITAPDDPEYVHHIGAMFYPKMFINKTGAMLDGTPFVLDTIIYNEWYQVKWKIKPLCILQCFAIGVFRDKTGPPVHSHDNDDIYYIDDVEIKELPEKGIEKPSVAFCRYENLSGIPISVEIDGTAVFFDSGDSVLSSNFFPALDSFAMRMKEHPEAAFSINGHTDNIGKSNWMLSKARVNCTLSYLEKKYNIPRCRFLQWYSGDLAPVASNNTNEGRRRNRRVEIKQVSYKLSSVIYRNVLIEVFNKHNETAFQYLNNWMAITTNDQKLVMQNDPRLDGIKSDKRWQIIMGKVKKSYQIYKKPLSAYSLDSLWVEDQRGRTLEKYIENIQTYIAEKDSADKRWNVFFPLDTGSVYEARAKSHLDKMTDIIHKNGWPKISEVGKRASKAAFLVMAHAQDTNLVSNVLPLLEKRCQEGEAEWIYFATISDHYLVMRGKPQKYGTQYKLDQPGETKAELFPLENPLLVNTWRAKLGLEPLREFIPGFK